MFQFQELSLPGVLLITTTRHEDRRGWFQEHVRAFEFLRHDIGPFAQENVAYSCQNVLRGLHYQEYPYEQGKLISVLYGEIFDVGVDLRKTMQGNIFKDSPTYKHWIGKVLSASNRWMLYFPPGFAHGYYVMSEEAVVLYKVTSEYKPEADRGIRWNDPDIGIKWPVSYPILSEKDRSLPFLKEKNHE